MSVTKIETALYQEPDTAEEYTSREVSRLAEVPLSTLAGWTMEGASGPPLLAPSIFRGEGTGSEHVFSACDLFLATMCEELRRKKIGFPVFSALAKVVRHTCGGCRSIADPRFATEFKVQFDRTDSKSCVIYDGAHTQALLLSRITKWAAKWGGGSKGEGEKGGD